jgi:putative ABC transport system permease protein
MTFFNQVRQSARQTLRDWRAGELRLLAAALVLAVGAVTSVGFLVDRIQIGLERDARALLGADVVLNSDRPLTADLFAAARAWSLSTAETVVFPSMAISEKDSSQTALAAVKAVSEGYPLRGALRVAARPDKPDAPALGIPLPGTVWVDPQVLQVLSLQAGDALRLGERMLRIDRVITIEPDRGLQFINFAPRVLMNLADLPATQLIQPGSRATYRLLAAGAPQAVRGYVEATRSSLPRGLSLESLESGRPDVQRALERAQRFLALVALLAALIAAVAVAAAARRFTERHLDACALMRCLGLTQREIFVLFALEFLLIGIVGCGFGVLLGYATHFLLLEALRGLMTTELPAPSGLPAVQGAVVGLVLLLGFTLPSLSRLRQAAPVRVLRRDLPTTGTRAIAGYALGAAGFLGLTIWTAGDALVGGLTTAGFAVAMAVFALMAWLALNLLRPLRSVSMGRGRIGGALRFALGAMRRRPSATIVQIVALAIGLMALLLLTVIRTDLVDAWRQAAPADAPNRFVINIQPQQQEEVAKRLRTVAADAALYPMVRGRLIEKNGAPLGPESFTDDRARRLVDREFNLSYGDAKPSHNPIVAGRWFAPDAAELSIESGIAKTLGISLGDRLVFDVAGTRVEARATSLRKVNWDSMRANFFVILPSRLLRDQPQTFITAFHVPAARAGEMASLLRDFPNLTVIDTSAVLRQVQMILDQVVAAVEILFGFTLAAGVLVLYAALASGRDERMREAALMRALGASRRQLANAQTVELILIGGLAGLLAAGGAAATGWALAYYAFEFDFQVSPWIFVAGIAAGACCAWVGGWFGLRDVLNAPPLTSLREL